ncbi:hypothetical protein BCR33DRAFT_484576 [Rhizoclosmatium globosum]|uniref:CID domain-containing protein n=1 Tax=Rhizoclosmatium globosum TaxID=329046 RepID=A0A1Y2BN58_9FUNG|nr:hypothetical protein BCR33DRAFT_484576 [Rhizoclosmatium globosum]|eukprot:ORY36142.1 hypothetical protein BCR33DRAFT_484576 [Rhizoclosmatium globosum]
MSFFFQCLSFVLWRNPFKNISHFPLRAPHPLKQQNTTKQPNNQRTNQPMAEVEFDKEVLSVCSAHAPLSASRIERITKLGVKYGRNYKAIVFSVERLVTKCPPEHKLSALYIIDSVVRACHKALHHQDYANLITRFEEKIEHMFPHMLSAPPKDKVCLLSFLYSGGEMLGCAFL